MKPGEGTMVFAAMVYATLPLTIGLFTWRHNWTGQRQASTGG